LIFFKFGGWIGEIIFMVFLHQGIQDFVSSVMSTMFSIAHVSQLFFYANGSQSERSCEHMIAFPIGSGSPGNGDL